MKYTRVKAVTCALTASVMIFGSAAHTNAAGVSHDLPAAGVALVLEEGSSLSGAQEEAGQGGQAPQQESAGESQETSSEAPAVTIRRYRGRGLPESEKPPSIPRLRSMLRISRFSRQLKAALA